MDALDDDLLLCIAPHLRSRELLRLALTCRRLGSRRPAPPAPGGAKGREDRGGRSLMEEAARAALLQGPTERERALLRPAIERGAPWLGAYAEWERLRVPLGFDHLVGDARYVARTDRANVVLPVSRETMVDENEGGWSCAFSDEVMRSGQHYVTFSCEHGFQGDGFCVGVMRVVEGLHELLKRSEDMKGPPYEPEFFGGELCDEYSRWSGKIHSYMQCFGQYGSGSIFHKSCGSYSFPTHTRSPQGGNEIGILLDLDDGIFAVYQDSRLLWQKKWPRR